MSYRRRWGSQQAPARAIEGYLDTVAGGIARGWARDTTSPSQPATVSLRCDGAPIGTTTADILRPDLKRAGVGDGKHGFAFHVPEGLEGELTAWVNGTQLQGAFKAPRLRNRIEGSLDKVDDGFARGWARDTGTPSQPAVVSICCKGAPIGTTVADLWRPDLQQAGVGEGKYGFAFHLPEGLDGELTAWVNGTQLQGAFEAPRPECRIQGCFDMVADGFAQGWARDSWTPSQPVVVSMRCNGARIGTTVADIFRPDLKQAGVGVAKYGFTFYVPEGLEGELTAWVDDTQLPGSVPLPRPLSEYGPHQRYVLAKQYLKGEGIEIGALERPMTVPEGVKVRTVDRLPGEELRAHYGLTAAITVDHVCDAEKLETIATGSQDFVIANHVFEHMENPIAALENWVRVVRPGGFVFMAIPDKRYTFDVDRTVTSSDHLLEEYRDAQMLAANRRAHYEDWVRNWEGVREKVDERIVFLMDSSYSIHFHCWTGADLLVLFERVAWLGFELDCYKSNRAENIFILRKLDGRDRSEDEGRFDNES